MKESSPNPPSSVTAIAREAIRMLTTRQLPATPTNYQQMYQSIARGGEVQLTAYEAIERLGKVRSDAAFATALSAAIRKDDWKEIQRLLEEELRKGSGSGPAATTAGGAGLGAEAATLIARLVQNLETHHSGITLSKKREGLKRALMPRGDSFGEFQQRLTRLMDSWSGPSIVDSTITSTSIDAEPVMQSDPRPAPVEESTSLTATNILAGLAGLAGIESKISKRIPLDTSGTLVSRLRSILKLLLQNIAELTPESEMLPIQIEQIERILADPLTEQKLDEAERVLRNIIIRQGTIKHGIEEAKSAAKELASSLIDRLTTLSTSAGSYTERVAEVTSRITKAENLTQLSHLVMSLLSDTQLMSSDMMRARDDLDAARAHARDLESRTKTLEAELARASALVRTDPLTEALNRRGFEEVYARQMKRPSGQPHCVALLDIDDFKRINDSYGHLVGDDALKYLSQVMRDITRPTDAVGRYGGEEFCVLFPNTPLRGASEVMTRIQRELTRRVFMQDHSRVLLTFSCGVTEIQANESLEDALLRADGALHEAKQKGKNKVVSV
ncbi:MAG: diguanylate cyclase [Burkholderiaceae bacterium]